MRLDKNKQINQISWKHGNGKSAAHPTRPVIMQMRFAGQVRERWLHDENKRDTQRPGLDAILQGRNMYSY